MYSQFFILFLFASATSTTPKCGVIPPKHRKFLDRETADHNASPWQIFIDVQRFNRLPRLDGMGFFGCSAVIVDRQWALTAASCLFDNRKRLEQVSVTGDGDDGKQPDKVAVKMNSVEKLIVHPQFKPEDKVFRKHNIALIKFKTELNFTDSKQNVNRICLTKNAKVKGKRCLISSFGEKKKSKGLTLKNFNLDIKPSSECKFRSRKRRFHPKDQLCSRMTVRHACTRSLGMPLQCPTSDGSMVLMGILSENYDCKTFGDLNVYTKVEHYYKWITETMKKDSDERSGKSKDKGKIAGLIPRLI